MNKKELNILTSFISILSIPFLLALIIIPTSITYKLTPSLQKSEKLDNSVLGVKQYKLNDVQISLSDEVSDKVFYNNSQKTLDINLKTKVNNSTVIFKNALIFENSNNTWKRVDIIPKLSEISKECKYILSINDIQYELVDSENIPVPVSLQLSPNEQISVDIIFDSDIQINYEINALYEITVN